MASTKAMTPQAKALQEAQKKEAARQNALEPLKTKKAQRIADRERKQLNVRYGKKASVHVEIKNGALVASGPAGTQYACPVTHRPLFRFDANGKFKSEDEDLIKHWKNVLNAQKNKKTPLSAYNEAQLLHVIMKDKNPDKVENYIVPRFGLNYIGELSRSQLIDVVENV